MNISEPEDIKKLLLILKNNPSNTDKVSSSIRSLIAKSVDLKSEETFSEGQNWLNAIVLLANSLKEISPDLYEPFLERTRIPHNHEFCFGVAFECTQSGNLDFRKLKLTLPKKPLLTTLLEYVENSPDYLPPILQALEHIQTATSRAEYLERIANRLRTNDCDMAARGALVRSFALVQDKISSDNSQLQDLVTDGTLVWSASSANEAEEYSILASILWLIIIHQNGVEPPNIPNAHPQLGNLAAARAWYTDFYSDECDDAVIKHLAAIVVQYKGFSDWADYAVEDATASNFFHRVFVQLVAEGRYNNLSISRALASYSGLKEILGEKLALKMLINLGRWNQGFADALAGEKCNALPTELIEDIQSISKKSEIHEVIGLLDKNLKSFSFDVWDKAMEAEGDPVRLLVVRRKKDKLTLPATNFRPALLQHIKHVLSGSNSVNKYADDWHLLTSSLSGNAKNVLLRDLLNAFQGLAITDQGAEHFVELYEQVATGMSYSEMPDYALSHFFSKLISSKNEHVHDVIDGLTSEIKRCIKNASTSSVESFVEAVQGIADSDDEDCNARANKYEKSFGLKLKQVVQDE